MPSIEQNIELWTKSDEWKRGGDQWSDYWGGPQTQWVSTILPRIQPFLPAGRVLEIAPGHGRWTQFLKALSGELYIVDLLPQCIEACRQRFADDRNIRYYVNDGMSLGMLSNHQFDFAFSFDSLVHAERDVVGSYLKELELKLKPDGVGFIHHSNLGEYRTYFRIADSIQRPWYLRKRLISLNVLESSRWRASSVSADLFDTLCKEAGLVCINQELVNWGTRRLIDCFSTFTPEGSKWARPKTMVRNYEFTARK